MSSRSRPPNGLKSVGRTFNTEYFEVAPDVLVVMPAVGTKDDAHSAEVNMDFQIAHARAIGRPCALVVVLSSLASQDAAARRIYARRVDPAMFFATALVVGNPLSRAIASFFLGLTRTKNPTRVVDSIEHATAWIDTVRPSNEEAL